MIGLVNGIMWLPAIILRPFVGRIIDRRGRKAFILLGVLINGAAAAAYVFSNSVEVILAIRVFHGASFACFYPSSSTMVGDISPTSRRAEAISYFSMFLFGGLAVGPAIGEHLYQSYGADVAFVTASAFAGLGFVLATQLAESFSGEVREEKPALLHRAAAFPAVVLGFVALGAGAADAFLPLYVSRFGSGDSRLYFTTFAVTIIVVRFFTGQVADRFGRGAIIVPGALLSGIALFVLASGAEPAQIVTAAVLRGVGWGAMWPGLFALLMDRVHPGERGSATGTFTAAFDLSFGGGQILLGVILEATSFNTIFFLGGASGVVGALVFLLWRGKSEKRFPVLNDEVGLTYPADDAASASS
jgi:MFS family permease